jgi:hypothetical protein
MDAKPQKVVFVARAFSQNAYIVEAVKQVASQLLALCAKKTGSIAAARKSNCNFRQSNPTRGKIVSGSGQASIVKGFRVSSFGHF